MKRTIRLNESELKRMIAESVKRALNEGDKYGGYLEELVKNIGYFHSNAMENLENLVYSLEEIPEEYSAMKNSQIAMVRNAIKTLRLAFKGLANNGSAWFEEGPSLSMMAKYPNVEK